MGNTTEVTISEISNFQKRIFEGILELEEDVEELKELFYEFKPEVVEKIKTAEKGKFLSEEEFEKEFGVEL